MWDRSVLAVNTMCNSVLAWNRTPLTKQRTVLQRMIRQCVDINFYNCTAAKKRKKRKKKTLTGRTLLGWEIKGQPPKVESKNCFFLGYQRDYHSAIIVYNNVYTQCLGYIGNAPWGFNKAPMAITLNKLNQKCYWCFI